LVQARIENYGIKKKRNKTNTMHKNSKKKLHDSQFGPKNPAK
jgi:hypothetical protein